MFKRLENEKTAGNKLSMGLYLQFYIQFSLVYYFETLFEHMKFIRFIPLCRWYKPNKHSSVFECFFVEIDTTCFIFLDIIFQTFSNDLPIDFLFYLRTNFGKCFWIAYLKRNKKFIKMLYWRKILRIERFHTISKTE